jgi:ribosomal protein S18 acetylase RimI-like enzyme
MPIRAAHWADKHAVAALIADALHTSPLAAWLIPDEPRRRDVLTDVLEIWVEHALIFGDVHVTDDLTAAAVGLHRLRPLPPPANYHQRLTDAAGPYQEHFTVLDTLLGDSHPTTPHYHLAFLAVAPSAQHTGLGTAMLTHHRNRLDSIDLPAVAETTTDSQHLYTRHGYTPHAEINLPSGPQLAALRRPEHPSGRRPINKTPSASDPLRRSLHA